MKEFPVEVFQVNGRTLFRFPQGNGFLEGLFTLERSGEVAQFVPVDQPWQLLFDSLDQFTDDFMEQRDQGNFEKRVSL